MKKFLSILLALAVLISPLGVPHTADATILPIAGSTYALAGGGVSPSATSITLQSFTLKQTGQKIADADLSDTFFITLEAGNNTRQEIASCTTVVQNANNTATLSGCTRGLSPITPFTASSTLKFSHGGGTAVTFADPPQFFNQYTAKENNETITGYWLAPDPLGAQGIATRAFVLSVVSGGTISTDKVTVTGTAGETLVAGNFIYLKTTDARWYKVNANTTDSVTDALLGIAQGAGTAGVSITSGVLLKGLDANQTGLTAGANYFASTTSGGIGKATTTKAAGKANTSTTIYFDPYFTGIITSQGNNTFTGTNTFSTASTTFNATTTISATSTAFIGSFPAYNIGKNRSVITSTGTSTFSVPSGITKIKVRLVGSGGAGGTASCPNSATTNSGGGGGAGGYAEEFVDVTGTSTIQVYVGATGFPTKFGTNGFYLSATAGTDGSGQTPGVGGVGSGGDLNINGQGGNAGQAALSSPGGGVGGSSLLGGGSQGGVGSAGGAAGNYGGGGGGNGCLANNSSAFQGGAGSQGVIDITW